MMVLKYLLNIVEILVWYGIPLWIEQGIKQLEHLYAYLHAFVEIAMLALLKLRHSGLVMLFCPLFGMQFKPCLCMHH